MLFATLTGTDWAGITAMAIAIIGAIFTGIMQVLTFLRQGQTQQSVVAAKRELRETVVSCTENQNVKLSDIETKVDEAKEVAATTKTETAEKVEEVKQLVQKQGE